MVPIFTSPLGTWGGKVKYAMCCDKEQRAKSKEQRAKSIEHRAKSKEQRALSKEQRTI
jgi:hypothetical protein